MVQLVTLDTHVLKYALEYFEGKYEVIASGRRKTDFFEKRGITYYSVDMSKKEDFDKLPQEDVYAVIDLAATIPFIHEGDIILMSMYNQILLVHIMF
ncbi:MAG: hypothetical protein ACLTTH_15955 [Holdemanella porci]